MSLGVYPIFKTQVSKRLASSEPYSGLFRLAKKASKPHVAALSFVLKQAPIEKPNSSFVFSRVAIFIIHPGS